MFAPLIVWFAPFKETVPLLCENVPDENRKSPDSERVPLVDVNVPPVMLSEPEIVML